jgi:hypothetical protein
MAWLRTRRSSTAIALDRHQHRDDSMIPSTKLLHLAAALLLVSCVKPQSVGGVTRVAGIDFTPYTKQGFFFSPGEYQGRYEPLGLISVTIMPPARQVKDSVTGFLRWQIEPLRVAIVVDSMFARAKAMGADALVHFSSRAFEDRIDATTTREAIEVSGFAIKRLPDR